MTPPAKTVKYILMAFVAVSIGAAIYKALPCGSGSCISADAAAEAAVPAVNPVPAAAPKNPAVLKAAPQKTALVYYFYTTARCYSCNLIETYTREAVAKHFAQSHNGWRVEFKGVNIDEKENEHFVRDYWLNSKSVVVQKFEGDKPLNWAMLKSVWQLLGDKDKFMEYIAVETRKVLDSK